MLLENSSRERYVLSETQGMVLASFYVTRFEPTMIFVEQDRKFVKKVATKVLTLT